MSHPNRAQVRVPRRLLEELADVLSIAAHYAPNGAQWIRLANRVVLEARRRLGEAVEGAEQARDGPASDNA